jgi:cytoskeletal protein CcmA (bactofilin family)
MTVAIHSQTGRSSTTDTKSQLDVSSTAVTTFGHGMLIIGNIACAGTIIVFGRVTGDIHASSLTIAEGGRIDGTITAENAVIRGAFKGTLFGGHVKIQGAAVVEGEVHNKTLSIEENAIFEGVARRLDRPVKAPGLDEIAAKAKMGLLEPDVLQLAPEQINAHASGIDEEVLA